MKFVIEGRLDDLNKYINYCRSNRYKGNQVKQQNEMIVALYIRKYRLKPVKQYPVALKIKWYEPNRRRDIDNITFAVKFIQDALVKSKILVNDSQKYINNIQHEVLVDKNNPRIEVEILEARK